MSAHAASWRERLLVLLQACLPTRALSRAVHAIAHWRVSPIKNALIRIFIRRFNVDMREAEEQAPDAFTHFNAFFTRALRPGARPLPEDEGAVVSPVDGSLSQLGRISDGMLIQAKGMRYSAEALLGEPAEAFRDGTFCTIYLAPYDYHRIHAPADLDLRGHRHIPGRLFSVNPATARARPALFARNERVVAHHEELQVLRQIARVRSDVPSQPSDVFHQLGILQRITGRVNLRGDAVADLVLFARRHGSVRRLAELWQLDITDAGLESLVGRQHRKGGAHQ